jgi:putative membrane protein
MMYEWGFGSGSGMGWGGWIVWLLILAGLIIGGIFFVKWLVRISDQNGFHAQESEAMEMLRTRYAAGEITREEFLKMKSDLEDLQE